MSRALPPPRSWPRRRWQIRILRTWKEEKDRRQDLDKRKEKEVGRGQHFLPFCSKADATISSVRLPLRHPRHANPPTSSGKGASEHACLPEKRGLTPFVVGKAGEEPRSPRAKRQQASKQTTAPWLCWPQIAGRVAT
eukprot:scaffold128_cov248-Pinguiococcus_pyrenoidosus.AAC.17